MEKVHHLLPGTENRLLSMDCEVNGQRSLCHEMRRHGSVERLWKTGQKASLQPINPRTQGPGLKTRRSEILQEVLEWV